MLDTYNYVHFARVLSARQLFKCEISRLRMSAPGINQWSLNGFNFILLQWIVRRVLNECSKSASQVMLCTVLSSKNYTALVLVSLDRVVSIMYLI